MSHIAGRRFGAAVRRGKDLAMAMEGRCSHWGEGGTKRTPLKYQARDRIAYIVTVVYMALMVVTGRFVELRLWIF